MSGDLKRATLAALIAAALVPIGSALADASAPPPLPAAPPSAPGQPTTSAPGTTTPTTIVASVEGSAPVNVPGSATIASCTWTLADDQSVILNERWPHTDATGRTWHLYSRDCGAGPTFVVVVDVAPGDLIDGAVGDLQRKVLPLPTPTFSPFAADFQWSYVKLPIDIRLSRETWSAHHVTASNGLWSATVTATPISLTFEPGDEHRDAPPAVTCRGDSPVVPYEPAHPGDCSYTYLHASSTSTYDGYHFLTRTTIMWSVAWVLTDATGAVTIDSGTRPDLVTTTQTPLAIAEVQAILTA